MNQVEVMDMLLGGTLEIIIAFDNAGHIFKNNRAAEDELGYETGLRNRDISVVLRKEFEKEEKFEKVIERLKEKKETTLYRQNGTCFDARIRIIYYEEKEQYFLFALDMESSRKMEHEVARIKSMAASAMEVKNEFVANVTHELRTPVNGIRGHVENLKDTYITAEQRKALDIIEHCCKNMSSIINNILDFSKLEAGKFDLEEQKFEFRTMVDNIVATNMASVNEKGLQLTVNIDENIPQYLIGDELRLTQILNNLLSNAVKFTAIGFIRVEVTMTMKFDDEVELFFMVVDSGIGISKEEQDRLFISFSQVDASITRKYGGTGLGLAITKELVELMNGKVYLESEKGRGSNFSFSVRLHTTDKGNTLEEYKKELFQLLCTKKAAEENEKIEKYYQFGSEENQSEINSRMEKIVLCIELRVWEKAEVWSDELKKLVENTEVEVKRAVLKLEMSIRKENYDTSMENYEKVRLLLDRKSKENI